MRSILHNTARKRHESGQAILVTLIVLTVVASLAGTAMLRTSGTGRLAARATDFSETERISDGLIEYAYGVWKGKTREWDGAITKAHIDALNLAGSAPSFTGFSMVDNLTIVPVDQYGAPYTATSTLSLIHI